MCVCSEEVTGSHSVWGVCGGVSGCTTGISGHRKSFGMCVVHWRFGSEHECVHVWVGVRRGCMPQRRVCLCLQLESAWQ